VTVRRRGARGEEADFRFDPYWVRLETDGAERLKLGSHGKHLSWFLRSLISLSGTNPG